MTDERDEVGVPRVPVTVGDGGPVTRCPVVGGPCPGDDRGGRCASPCLPDPAGAGPGSAVRVDALLTDPYAERCDGCQGRGCLCEVEARRRAGLAEVRRLADAGEVEAERVAMAALADPAAAQRLADVDGWQLVGPVVDDSARDWAAEDEAANRCPHDGAPGVDGSAPCACGRGARSSRRDAPVLVDGEALASFVDAGRSAISAAFDRAGLTPERVAGLFGVPVGMVYGGPSPSDSDHIPHPVRDPEPLWSPPRDHGQGERDAQARTLEAEMAALGAAAAPGVPLECEWGWAHPEGGVVAMNSEAFARDMLARVPGSSLFCRVVGPWVGVGGLVADVAGSEAAAYASAEPDESMRDVVGDGLVARVRGVVDVDCDHEVCWVRAVVEAVLPFVAADPVLLARVRAVSGG